MRLDTRSIFNKGEELFKKRLYIQALNCFSLTEKNDSYKEKSFYYIVKINIILGNFETSRNMLDGIYKSKEYYNCMGMLESSEFNFFNAIEYFMKYKSNNREIYSYLNIAKLLMNIGEFEYANKILIDIYKLRNNDKFYLDTLVSLVTLNLYLKDYDKTRHFLKLIKKNNLCNEELYKKLNIVLLFLEGKDPSSFEYTHGGVSHIKNVLCENMDKIILHLNDHKISDERSNGFYKDIDLNKLYLEIQEKIKDTNFCLNKHYAYHRFRLDRNIGIMNGKDIDGICVATLIGTQKIISFFPQEYSSSFDKEGLVYNEEVKKKLSI